MSNEIDKLKAKIDKLKAKIEDDEITRHMMCGDYSWVEMVTKLLKENEQLKAKIKEYEVKDVQSNHDRQN